MISFSILYSVSLTLLFVGSLYIYPSKGKGRDHRDVIISRFLSIFVVSLIGYFTSGLSLEAVGLTVSVDSLYTAVICLLLTCIFFLGPIVYLFYEFDSDPNSYFCDIPDLTQLTTIRALIFAPIFEEFCFRGLMVPLLIEDGYSPLFLTFFTPFLFGVAHLHHIWNQGFAKTMMQIIYTSIFGSYTSYLFVKTGNLYGPILAHAFCNYMGFPDFEAHFTHHKKIGINRYFSSHLVIIPAYFIGPALFFYVLISGW
eukprot:TRINITY_DN5863_c0_g1_i1.p1 TRINITY_DN5863_c0_g1~~TRINITY_DN5863_c0_g1_i1.p1  ORF type:complete len:255 (+),score=12.86 TRINITY_DN5863_c0_g1_i1:83-847(+)